MKLKIVEPLRMIFKDEVRRVGASMGIDPELVKIMETRPMSKSKRWRLVEILERAK